MGAAAEKLARHEDLVSIRAPEEKAWRDIAFMLRPDDVDLGVDPTRQRNDAEVFDSSPMLALDNFEGGMFAQMANPTNRWAELTLPDKDLARWGPVKTWLWEGMNALYASLSPSVSSFYAQVPSTFADTGAFGFGTLSQQERVGKGRIADRAIPIGQTYVDVDEEGEVDTFHNAFMWRGRQVKQFFKEAAPADVREDRSYKIVHAVAPNPEYRPDRLGAAYQQFAGCYVSPDIKGLYVEGGYPELPYHMFAWKRRGGRVYPRGIGHSTRADANSLNEMERSHLVAGQFAAEPPVLLRDEEVMSAADIVPNALLYGGMSEKGEQLASFMERRQQVQLSLAQSEQKRTAIKTAFLFGLMQLINRPQMTATEFTGFQVEILRLMAPYLVQFQAGLSKFLARRFRILGEAGRLPPPPPELANQTLDVDYVSPLAKVQKMDEGRAVLAFHEGIEKFALTDPNVRDRFDADAAAEILHDSLYVPPKLIRSIDDANARRSARADQQQQLDQVDQAGKVVSIAAEASHAMQAASLSQQRGQAA